MQPTTFYAYGPHGFVQSAPEGSYQVSPWAREWTYGPIETAAVFTDSERDDWNLPHLVSWVSTDTEIPTINQVCAALTVATGDIWDYDFFNRLHLTHETRNGRVGYTVRVEPGSFVVSRWIRKADEYGRPVLVVTDSVELDTVEQAGERVRQSIRRDILSGPVRSK